MLWQKLKKEKSYDLSSIIFGVSNDYQLGRSNNGLVDTIETHIDSNASEKDIKE